MIHDDFVRGNHWLNKDVVILYIKDGLKTPVFISAGNTSVNVLNVECVVVKEELDKIIVKIMWKNDSVLPTVVIDGPGVRFVKELKKRGLLYNG
jgi:hypothetical protein